MLLVILGAGASYDSIPSLSPVIDPNAVARPPLANQLFDNRPIFADALKDFPICHPIVPYLQDLPKGTSLEENLEELQEESTSDPHRKRQLAGIQYYLQSMLSQCERVWEPQGKGISNYKTLLDQIRHAGGTQNNVCIVTFNYDSLLESAFRSLDIRFLRFEDYIENQAYPLIKLHGSITWAREIDSVIPDLLGKNAWQVAETVIQHADSLSLSNRYQFVSEIPVSSMAGVPLYPALAIPVQSKQEYQCPESHVQFLMARLGDIKQIVTIGWRGNERHFLDLLRSGLKHQVDALIVAGSSEDATETAANLSFACVNQTLFDAGFTMFIKSRKAESFFRW